MRDGWIKPNGQFVEVEGSHNKFAYDFLEKKMGNMEKLYEYMNIINVQYPYEVLHKKGWVRVKFGTTLRIVGNCIDMTKPMRNTMDPPMNRAQLRTAKMICEEMNTSLHKAINSEIFW